VSFEIVGMLGRTLHIDNSSFTYVPNPTPDRWDKRSVSLIRLLESYGKSFEEHYPLAPRMYCNPSIVKKIRGHVDTILGYRGEDLANTPLERLLFLNAVHVALADADEILTAKPRVKSTPEDGKPDRPAVHQREKSEDVMSKITPSCDRQVVRRQLVQDVLRSHIQEVLRQLNDADSISDNQSLRLPDGRPSSPSHTGQPRPPHHRFEEINEASPDERESMFMDVYFGVIRPEVVKRAKTSTKRRASNAAGIPEFRLNRAETALSEPAYEERSGRLSIRPQTRRRSRSVGMNSVSPDRKTNEKMGESDQEETDEESDDDYESPPPPDIDLADEEASHHDIWCVLVFRMICWLMLHDFNKLDVQVSKSELLGSRMPVYIA
jgi:hypothetical protein